jgi:hypothetical protein
MHTPESPEVPQCFPVKKVIRYKAKMYGRIAGEHAMMKELLNGPITCGIGCSDEFTWNYTAGIFEDKTNFTDVDHDVEIVGWGEEDGVKYWKVRNSWGTYWGMNGFFKIIRGVNNLAIESDCHFIVPEVSEEDLVFSEKPIYGGSHWGIVPFSKKAEEHLVETTDDVVLNNFPLHSEELPLMSMNEISPEKASEHVVKASSTSGVSILGLVFGFICLGAVVGFSVARRSRDQYYARIN